MSGWLFAVDEPWNAKLINQNAEAKRPKCFLQRRLNSSVFGQAFEDALGFHGIAEIKLQSDALRFLITFRRRIRAVKREIGMSERGMADLLANQAVCADPWAYPRTSS